MKIMETVQSVINNSLRQISRLKQIALLLSYQKENSHPYGSYLIIFKEQHLKSTDGLKSMFLLYKNSKTISKLFYSYFGEFIAVT